VKKITKEKKISGNNSISCHPVYNYNYISVMLSHNDVLFKVTEYRQYYDENSCYISGCGTKIDRVKLIAASQSPI